MRTGTKLALGGGVVAAVLLLLEDDSPGLGDLPVQPLPMPPLPQPQPQPQPLPQPLPQQPTAPAVLAASTRDTPTIGFLYQIRQGDNATNVARRALGFPKDSTPPGQGTRVVNYVRRMTASRWNLEYYATRPPAGLPPGYQYEWGGTRWTLAVAPFLPGNDNVAAAVAQGELPVRRYRIELNPNTGAPIPTGATPHGGTGYGRIFLPPEDPGDPNAKERNPSALLAALGVSLVG